jgi:hypothetical protein
VLHGSQVHFAAVDALNARVINGAVLKAILERDAAMRRLGCDETQQDLLDEIRFGKEGPMAMPENRTREHAMG